MIRDPDSVDWRDVDDVLAPFAEAVLGRARVNSLRLGPEAIFAQELIGGALVGGQRIAGAVDMRFVGLERAYVVTAHGKMGGSARRAFGTTYAAAAVVLIAARVEAGLWELRRPPAPGERLPGVEYPLAPLDELVKAVASSVVLSGYGETAPKAPSLSAYAEDA